MPKSGHHSTTACVPLTAFDMKLLQLVRHREHSNVSSQWQCTSRTAHCGVHFLGPSRPYIERRDVTTCHGFHFTRFIRRRPILGDVLRRFSCMGRMYCRGVQIGCGGRNTVGVRRTHCRSEVGAACVRHHRRCARIGKPAPPNPP